MVGLLETALGLVTPGPDLGNPFIKIEAQIVAISFLTQPQNQTTLTTALHIEFAGEHEILVFALKQKQLQAALRAEPASGIVSRAGGVRIVKQGLQRG